MWPQSSPWTAVTKVPVRWLLVLSQAVQHHSKVYYNMRSSKLQLASVRSFHNVIRCMQYNALTSQSLLSGISNFNWTFCLCSCPFQNRPRLKSNAAGTSSCELSAELCKRVSHSNEYGASESSALECCEGQQRAEFQTMPARPKLRSITVCNQPMSSCWVILTNV